MVVSKVGTFIDGAHEPCAQGLATGRGRGHAGHGYVRGKATGGDRVCSQKVAGTT